MEERPLLLLRRDPSQIDLGFGQGRLEGRVVEERREVREADAADLVHIQLAPDTVEMILRDPPLEDPFDERLRGNQPVSGCTR